MLSERDLNKADYVKMLYDQVGYLKQDIDDYAKSNGANQWALVTDIKVQANRIMGICEEAQKLHD